MGIIEEIERREKIRYVDQSQEQIKGARRVSWHNPLRDWQERIRAQKAEKELQKKLQKLQEEEWLQQNAARLFHKILEETSIGASLNEIEKGKLKGFQKHAIVTNISKRRGDWHGHITLAWGIHFDVLEDDIGNSYIVGEGAHWQRNFSGDFYIDFLEGKKDYRFIDININYQNSDVDIKGYHEVHIPRSQWHSNLYLITTALVEAFEQPKYEVFPSEGPPPRDTGPDRGGI